VCVLEILLLILFVAFAFCLLLLIFILLPLFLFVTFAFLLVCCFYIFFVFGRVKNISGNPGSFLGLDTMLQMKSPAVGVSIRLNGQGVKSQICFIVAVPQLLRSLRGDVMPARSPSLVLRAVKTTAVADSTLVAAIFFPLACRHLYLLRSSGGLGLRLVKVEGCGGESRPREMAAESLLAQGCNIVPERQVYV